MFSLWVKMSIQLRNATKIVEMKGGDVLKKQVSRYGEYKRLKLALFDKKVNYRQAAEIAGVSVSAFSNKINGKVDFKLEEIFRLCEGLDLDYTFILEEKLQNATKG